MSDTFKSGDVVKLKSTSPNMTVRTLSSDGKTVYCQWFAGTKLLDGAFGVESLVKAKKDDE